MEIFIEWTLKTRLIKYLKKQLISFWNFLPTGIQKWTKLIFFKVICQGLYYGLKGTACFALKILGIFIVNKVPSEIIKVGRSIPNKKRIVRTGIMAGTLGTSEIIIGSSKALKEFVNEYRK